MRNRTAVSVVSMVTVIAVLGIVAFWHAVTHDLPLPRSSSCVVTGGGAGQAGDAGVTAGDVVLNPQRMANAATIAAVGLRRGVPRRGIVVALATASQESKLDNLPAGDRDSIGLFQQRPSQGWGGPEQISDPVYASNAFYASLVKVRGWEQMRVTDAAQAVQHSAHPEAYERWVDRAKVLARAFTGDTSGAVSCTIPGSRGPRGVAAATALAAGLRRDWGDVGATDDADLLGVALRVADTRTGWQYAHWLVAHAAERGVTRVRFADLQWTARTGSWRRAGDATTADNTVMAGDARVLAEVNAA